MATLCLEKQFLLGFHKLQPPVRRKVLELVERFREATHAGVHLEKLKGSRDSRTRTVRVDDFWRGVAVDLGNDNFALLRVMPHDDANTWAVNLRCGVNSVTGVVEVINVPMFDRQVDLVLEPQVSGKVPLFDGVSDAEFHKVGIDPDLVASLRRLTSEDELVSVSKSLPVLQADAAILLAAGESPDHVLARLVAEYGIPARPIDTNDIDTALGLPATRADFVVATDDRMLAQILGRGFEAWRVFLHPRQHQLAYEPAYEGPVHVTGGAGTGKTVVAIHRARFLVSQLRAAGDWHSKVLVATFTTALAANLKRQLRQFCNDEYSQMQVTHVDRLWREVFDSPWSGLTSLPRSSGQEPHARPGPPQPRFAHAVVDEAQDMQAHHWWLLRAIVAPGTNDLFIVGDDHQRIYSEAVQMASEGINTESRRHSLHVNYRTSQQILRWALRVLSGSSEQTKDSALVELGRYRSVLQGPEPESRSFTTRAQMNKYIATIVQEWITEGVSPGSIGLLARTHATLETVKTAFDRVQVKWSTISKADSPTRVKIGTMHMSKGLEFARVILIETQPDLHEGALEAPTARWPGQTAATLQLERNLRYVAGSRARDLLVITSVRDPRKLEA